MMPSPHLVEVAGVLGFDWVLLDQEHAGISLEAVELMAMAGDAVGIAVLARPAENTPAAIAALLDRGVAGVQLPHVQSVDQAVALVRWVKFAPEGERSLAVGTRAGRYGLVGSHSEFVRAANQRTLVCIQIEDLQGLEQLNDLVMVPGIDVIFLGPSDLSQALGYPGQIEAEPVQMVIHAAFRTILAAGKVAGCAGRASAIARYNAAGAQYLYTHLTTLLQTGGTHFFDTVRHQAT